MDYFSAATGLDSMPDREAPQDQATVQPVDYFSQAAGLDKIGAQPAAQRPKQEGWGEWIANSVRGRHDPAYAGVEAGPRVGQQYRDTLEGPMAAAAALGSSDDQLGDIVQRQLGDKFIRREKDANGYDVFVTRGPDGKEQQGYLNKPGLDMQDVGRGVMGALPYVAGAGAVGAAAKGAGMGVKALLQGAAAAGTSIAGDVAQVPLGSEQGVDLTKAAVTGGVGGLAEPLAAGASALWRRFVTIPGLVDSQSGQLTAKGIAAANEAGIDPADLTPDFAQAFAKSFASSNNPATAATDASLQRFNIPATQGQITKDPYLLTQEEGMRRRIYGEGAQNTMRGFDQKQQEAVARAAFGDDAGRYVGIGGRVNPERVQGGAQADRSPAVLGSNVQDTLQSARQTAKSQESALWGDGVRDLSATPEALANLTPHMEKALADETAFTTTGETMAKEIGQFSKGELPVNEAGGIRLKQVQSVDQMRRRLGGLVGSAERGSDKNQAGKIYDAFNDWIGDSAEKALLSGDPEGALKLVKARGFTREVRQIFEAKAADGTLAPGARRLGKVLDDAKADSGEGVVQALLGSQGSRGVNDGSVSALKNVKMALDRFASPDDAKQAWNDIRLANWSRLVTGKNGELLGPTAMVNNLKSAISGQTSLLQTLYSPAELRQISQFVRALETIAYKPPNASGSGYTAASFAKEGIMKLIDAFGIGTPVRAALERTGVTDAWNAAAAKQAINRIARPVRPNLAPAATSAAQAGYRAQDGGR